MRAAIIVLILMILMFSLAFYWEVSDYLRLEKKRTVYDIKDKKEKEREYIFYSTFNYENAVTWRAIYISSGFATILIYYILSATGAPVTLETIIAVFFMIFFVLYYMDNFKSFHMWRVMASKIKPQTIL